MLPCQLRPVVPPEAAAQRWFLSSWRRGRLTGHAPARFNSQQRRGGMGERLKPAVLKSVFGPSGSLRLTATEYAKRQEWQGVS